MTTRQIKAHFRGGVFVPDEAIELEDGCEAQIIVDDQITAEDAGDSVRRPRILEIVDDIHREFPPEQWGHHPPDFVQNKKHYLYGYPKEEA